MRDAFVRELFKAAKSNSNIHLITGDLGFGVLTKFEASYPEQYTNAGVAEQNMTGLAAGLAMNGFKVFTYSIGNFSTLRCLEQIRNDVCYHGLDVTIISIGGGFSYGSLGYSHHATEDLSILRSLPGLSVYVPGCVWETAEITAHLLDKPGPKYLRLDKSGVQSTRVLDERFEFERLRLVPEAGAKSSSSLDVLIVAAGGILEEALTASSILRNKGLACRVMSAHSLKPFDTDGLLSSARRASAIFSLEENVIEGGLGSLVAEQLLEGGVWPKKFGRLGIRATSLTSLVGDQKYLRESHGLLGSQIAPKILGDLDLVGKHEKLPYVSPSHQAGI